MTKTKNVMRTGLIVILSFCVFLLTACSDTLKPETQKEIEKAYLEYLKQKDERYCETKFVYYSGTYSGKITALLYWEKEGESIVTANVDLYVDDFFVCTLPQGNYSVVIYDKNKKIMEINDAYAEREITKSELKSIARKLNQYK